MEEVVNIENQQQSDPRRQITVSSKESERPTKTKKSHLKNKTVSNNPLYTHESSSVLSEIKVVKKCTK